MTLVWKDRVRGARAPFKRTTRLRGAPPGTKDQSGHVRRDLDQWSLVASLLMKSGTFKPPVTASPQVVFLSDLLLHT